MVDGEFAPEAHEGKEVYDASGALLGTVGEGDADEGVLYLEPDPDPAEEAWGVVDGETAVSVDNNWFMTPDYKVRDVEDAEDVGEGVEFEEWPYTIGEEAIDEIDGDEIRLKY